MIALIAMTAMLPAFDTQAYCARIGDIGALHSSRLEVACYEQEIAAIRRLRHREIAPPIFALCDRIAQPLGYGSYHLFEACVDQEEAAERALGR